VENLYTNFIAVDNGFIEDAKNGNRRWAMRLGMKSRLQVSVHQENKPLDR
jgi:hypothetical protein